MILKGTEVPTARSIRKALDGKVALPSGLTYMRSLLKEMGFVWRKCETNRTLLMERADVVAARIQFLRQMK